MRILITGAAGNVGRGIIPRLRKAGHELVLTDAHKLPDQEPFEGLAFVQCDLTAGFGLERAAQGCDLILHLAAWHGMYTQIKTEADFWRLNVTGTFWMFQAAQSADIKRVVFLSSHIWHDDYNMYRFTKRLGEELCEYNRWMHEIRHVIVRPADFTPWESFTDYGRRLLYGGVDREDVLECIHKSIDYLDQSSDWDSSIVVNAVRAPAYTAQEIAAWENDPLAACEQIFPGSARLVEKYKLDIRQKPIVIELGEGADQIGYVPARHFGTFIKEMEAIDQRGGRDAVQALRCPY